MVGDAASGEQQQNGPNITIMDGSMGRQLCIEGLPMGELFHKVWSASALVLPEYHDMVVKAHLEYVNVGATILVTNAYGVQPNYYKNAFGEDPGCDWYAKMLGDAELAAKFAVRARDMSGKSSSEVRVFGCLPPICESHDPRKGSEYVEANGEAFVVKAYRELAEAALRGGADGLILENPVSIEEAKLMLAGVHESGADVPLILSFEGALRAMDRTPEPRAKAPLAARVAIDAKLQKGQRIEALGFSCTEPETIIEALQAVHETPGLSDELESAGIVLSVHANLNDRKAAHKQGFKVADAKTTQTITKRRDLVEDNHAGYVEFCREVVDHYNVRYVGGCCGCGHDGILRIAEEFGQRRKTHFPRGSVEEVRHALAPNGKLRVGINTANKLLVKEEPGDSTNNYGGIAPELGKRLAEELGGGTKVQLVPYPSPGEMASDSDSWDVAFMGADPTRAKTVAFSDPYAEIPCSFMVPSQPSQSWTSKFSNIKEARDVLQAGANVRIASFQGACYDLWLSKNLPSGSTIVHASSWLASVDLVKNGQADVVAGVVGLMEKEDLSEWSILSGDFMTVAQAIGFPLKRGSTTAGYSTKAPQVVKLLRKFVRENLDLVRNTFKETGVSSGAMRAVQAVEGPSWDPLRVTILGCGAMGSIYAALFASAGNEVHVVDVWGAHIDAINSRGLRVEGASGDRRVQLGSASASAEALLERLECARGLEDKGDCRRGIPRKRRKTASGFNCTNTASGDFNSDLVIIATKAQHVAEAMKTAAQLLDKANPNSGMLLIQNGIGTTRESIEALGIDPSTVMLGIASNFGAKMCGPGHAEHKSMNLIVVGEMVNPTPGVVTERLKFVEQAWARAGFTVQASGDIHAQMWQKLLCNCAFSGSSVCTGFTVGQMLDCPQSRQLTLSCAKEAGRVAQKKGITFGWTTESGDHLTEEEFDKKVEEYVLKFGSTVRDAKPSALQDFEAGRKCEIDAINGAIPGEAAKVGLTAPTNQVIADLVRAKQSVF